MCSIGRKFKQNSSIRRGCVLSGLLRIWDKRKEVRDHDTVATKTRYKTVLSEAKWVSSRIAYIEGETAQGFGIQHLPLRKVEELGLQREGSC